jgi:hypothetical protein
MSRSSWTVTLLFVLPHIVGMTGTRHCTQPLVGLGSCEVFAQVGLEPLFSQSPSP